MKILAVWFLFPKKASFRSLSLFLMIPPRCSRTLSNTNTNLSENKKSSNVVTRAIHISSNCLPSKKNENLVLSHEKREEKYID